MRQSIIGYPHEVRRLMTGAGTVLFVRPADVPPGTFAVSRYDPPDGWIASFERPSGTLTASVRCPYPLGARLAVRETWAYHPDDDGILYRATDPGWDDNDTGLPWRSASSMPLWASRLTVEVTAVTCERVCEIKESDATLCGFESGMYPPDDDGERWFKRARVVFEEDWETRYGARYPFASSWAWFVEARKVERKTP